MKRTLAILISLFVVSAAACDGDNGPVGLCGNGVVDTIEGEGCDGDDFGGATCGNIGFVSGDLACDPDTCLFIISECVGRPNCGDGNLDAYELCEGDNLDNNNCTTIGEGFDGGTLACLDDCTFDTTNCTP